MPLTPAQGIGSMIILIFCNNSYENLSDFKLVFSVENLTIIHNVYLYYEFDAHKVVVKVYLFTCYMRKMYYFLTTK